MSFCLSSKMTSVQIHGGGGCRNKKTTMEIKWLTANPSKPTHQTLSLSSKRLPIYISTNPSHINPFDLRHLYAACNLSCHRFPEIDHRGTVVESVDVNKLKIALSHSAVVVSVFCKEDVVNIGGGGNEEKDGNLLRRFMEISDLGFVSPTNGKLVGFGRAVSDLGLTGAIYDVMVIPSLRRMGIGKMIVKRIIRMLTSKDIYDISAVCSANERLFFKECGFGDDMLGSTTMMYSRSVSSRAEGNSIIKAGRKLLLVPPNRSLPCSLKIRS